MTTTTVAPGVYENITMMEVRFIEKFRRLSEYEQKGVIKAFNEILGDVSDDDDGEN